jgi:hypothetical protein
MKTRHLTRTQTQALAEIIGDDFAGAFEVLITVANMAKGRVDDFAEACEVADEISKAARKLKNSEVRP